MITCYFNDKKTKFKNEFENTGSLLLMDIDDLLDITRCLAKGFTRHVCLQKSVALLLAYCFKNS